MRRTILAIGVLAIALGASACAGNPEVPKAMPGSYETVKVTDGQVLSAAKFAVDAKQKALSAAGETTALELVGVLAAERQVVAGVNYRLELRVRRNGAEQVADAVVWWQSWRQPDPYQLTSWDWR